MKVFISQPMRDKTDKEIDEVREKAEKWVRKNVAAQNEDVEIIDSFFRGAPHNSAPLWFLGKSIQLLSTADIAVFAPGWDEYRGCRFEHEAACLYGIEVHEL